MKIRLIWFVSKLRLIWFVSVAVSVVAGWYVYHLMPDGLYPYGGPELVPAFSPLDRAGYGCGVGGACFALLVGTTHLVRTTGRVQQVPILAAVAGWSLLGFVIALDYSLIDARATILARPNTPGLHWTYIRAILIGSLWACVVLAIPLTWQWLHRPTGEQVRRCNRTSGHTATAKTEP